MRFIVPLKTLIAFLFILIPTLGQTETYAIPDTPIMAKYRKYYEINNQALNMVYLSFLDECREKCTEKDRSIIREKAKLGDMFSLSIRGYETFPPEIGDKFIKQAADKGEAYSAARYCMLNIKNPNIAEPEKYCKSAKSKGNRFGYLGLAILYSRNNLIPQFCASMNDGYRKFGLDFIYTGPKDIFFTNCTKAKEKDVLMRAGVEGDLIKGFQLIRSNDYEGAYKLFESIYKKGGSSKISANAGYCLGVMNYYGNGTPQNQVLGEKLLKDSWNAGVLFYNATKLPYSNILPEKEIIVYGSSPCGRINNK